MDAGVRRGINALGPEVDTVGIERIEKNAWIVQDHRYDVLGRHAWQSNPRIEGEPVAAQVGSSFEYDNAGRLTKSITPLGTTTRVYEGDKVTMTEPGPVGIATILRSVEADPLGRTIASTDALQKITRHVHGSFGALRRIELPDGTVRETKQDAYGRGTNDDDPDRGATILEFNGFDEVVKLHDALERHFDFAHDALGRTTRRTEGQKVTHGGHSVWTRDVVDVAGQTMMETFGNGVVTERLYDDKTFVLESILSMSRANILQSLRYAYDGLVNAKGRIYDPLIARFLQTDPVIANPLDAQTVNPYSYVFNRPLVLTDPSGYDAEATSILIYGAGSPEYLAPDHAQLVPDTQQTTLMRWPRESASTTVAVTQSPVAAGAPPPALALADSAEPDVPQLAPAWMEFGAGVAAGSIVGITPFGTMVDPVRNQPALGNHTDDYPKPWPTSTTNSARTIPRPPESSGGSVRPTHQRRPKLR